MPDNLKDKSKNRTIGGGERKPLKIEVLPPHQSPSFVKEQTIVLDPKHGPRGGKTGVTIGANKLGKLSKKPSITHTSKHRTKTGRR
jgi:hypothetical protein